MAVTARVPVYCDLSRAIFVGGKKNTEQTTYPLGRQVLSKANLNLVVYPLAIDPDGTTTAPFNAVSVSGVSLSAAIYDSTGATLLAEGTSFTADDTAGTLTGALNLNTAAMATAVGSSSSISAIAEFRFTGSTWVQNVRGTIAILKQLNNSGSPTAIPGATYLTAEEIAALFVKKQGAAGEGFVLTSPDGNMTALVYLDNDGSIQTDPIS